jgi:hypothetical protein
MTEDGIQIDGGRDAPSEDDVDEDELRDEPGDMYQNKNRRPSDMMKRKIWFNKAMSDEGEEDEEEEERSTTPLVPELSSAGKQNGNFSEPCNNFYRRIRKDSIAISLRSVRSTRSMRATPEP